ncbi:diguanylate cyclase [Salmonella enterica]|nr:diguanylate cyclase [Salmonella enterica]EDX8752049.1 diguanylate cyclase [Salmonella enterica subsp. enterica serovar 4,[5],12:b:-]EBD9517348.1 diguanylate cyclase [Salmonella enterica]EBE4462540.1 diguanylate cyclase [Salmonella enterica]EBF1000130.1 diguanylate cyclase [Salmonella enterica]
MNKEFSLSRPTFKRTLRRISIISVLLTMTLIWLLICVASVLTLKQYAQKNLDLTAATMAHSLEAALVFSDNTAAAETLATLGRQGQFSAAEVRDKNGRIIASWRYDARAADDKLIGLISHWLFPLPVSQPVWHNGRAIGEVRLVARDSLIGHFIWLSLAVLTGCILLASGIALLLTRYLHNGVVDALQNITEVVHDVRTNRNFSRRVLIEVAKRLAEFGGSRYQTYRLGGDEFAMVLYGVHSEYEVQRICAALSQAFNRPFELHNGQRITMTLSIGFALTWEHATAEKLQELADRNMYQAKHRRAERSLN